MINLLHNHKPTSCRCNIEVTLKQVVASVVRNRDFYQKWPCGQSKGKRSWTLLNLSSGLFVYSSVALCNSVSWFIHANLEAQSRVIEGSCKQINLTSVRPPARYFCSVKHSQWIHHALSKRQWLLCEKLSFHTRRDLNTKLWWSQHGWSLMRNRSGQAIHQGVMVKYDSPGSFPAHQMPRPLASHPDAGGILKHLYETHWAPNSLQHKPICINTRQSLKLHYAT